MHPVDEAWGRFAATTKYSLRRTLAQATANRKAVLTILHWEPGGSMARVVCRVCSRPIHLGYKVMLPTGRPREWATGYVHMHPYWCRVALGDALTAAEGGTYAAERARAQGGEE